MEPDLIVIGQRHGSGLIDRKVPGLSGYKADTPGDQERSGGKDNSHYSPINSLFFQSIIMNINSLLDKPRSVMPDHA